VADGDRATQGILKGMSFERGIDAGLGDSARKSWGEDTTIMELRLARRTESSAQEQIHLQAFPASRAGVKAQATSQLLRR
jgi:hypothetical protein